MANTMTISVAKYLELQAGRAPSSGAGIMESGYTASDVGRIKQYAAGQEISGAPAPALAGQETILQPIEKVTNIYYGAGVLGAGAAPLGVFNGYQEYAGEIPGERLLSPTIPGVTPAMAPLAAIGVGGLTVGLLKGLLAKYGPVILKAILGAGVFATFMKLLGIGAGDDTPVKSSQGKKRYSIGGNPRLNTLLKVAKRVDNIFVSYDKRISKFRGRLRGTGRTKTRYVYNQNKYLSPVEKKALARG